MTKPEQIRRIAARHSKRTGHLIPSSFVEDIRRGRERTESHPIIAAIRADLIRCKLMKPEKYIHPAVATLAKV